jgi:hypothetical protein
MVSELAAPLPSVDAANVINKNSWQLVTPGAEVEASDADSVVAEQMNVTLATRLAIELTELVRTLARDFGPTLTPGPPSLNCVRQLPPQV